MTQQRTGAAPIIVQLADSENGVLLFRSIKFYYDSYLV